MINRAVQTGLLSYIITNVFFVHFSLIIPLLLYIKRIDVQKYFSCTISNKLKHALARTKELRSPNILPFSFWLGNTTSIKRQNKEALFQQSLHQSRNLWARKSVSSN
jgi:hypothetical protein